jgi:hypothetical protein
MNNFLAAVAAFIVGRAMDSAKTSDALKQAREEEERQREIHRRKQLVQLLAPGTPMFGLEDSEALRAMDARDRAVRDQSRQQTISGAIGLIPAGVGAIGDAFNQPTYPGKSPVELAQTQQLDEGIYDLLDNSETDPWNQRFGA